MVASPTAGDHMVPPEGRAWSFAPPLATVPAAWPSRHLGCRLSRRFDLPCQSPPAAGRTFRRRAASTSPAPSADKPMPIPAVVSVFAPVNAI